MKNSHVYYILVLLAIIVISCVNSLQMRNISNDPIDVEIILVPNIPYVVNDMLTITWNCIEEVSITIHDRTVYEAELKMETPDEAEIIKLNSEKMLQWGKYTIEFNGYMYMYSVDHRLGLRIKE